MRNLKKALAIVLAMAVCMALCACEIQTPSGTLNLTFDESKKSEQTTVIDEKGNRTVIPTDSITAYVDMLLGQVALPQGTSTAELKSFVYNSLGAVGIDLSMFDNPEAISDAVSSALESSGVDLTDTEQVEKIIKDTLEQNGVDTSNVSIDLDSLIKEADSNEEKDGE